MFAYNVSDNFVSSMLEDRRLVSACGRNDQDQEHYHRGHNPVEDEKASKTTVRRDFAGRRPSYCSRHDPIGHRELQSRDVKNTRPISGCRCVFGMSATLKLLDADVRHLFASWFNRGFLEL